MDRPSVYRRLSWALGLRCPNCGQRKIFRQWFRMEKQCPNCRLVFERMPGYWLGAMIFNFAYTATAFLLMLVIGMIATWPDVPWTPLTYTGLAIGGLVPAIAFPWSRTVFAAIELAMRPPEPTDFGKPA